MLSVAALLFTGVNSELPFLYRKFRYNENTRRQKEATVISLKVCLLMIAGFGKMKYALVNVVKGRCCGSS